MFDLMPTDDRATTGSASPRGSATVPGAIDGYIATLRAGARRGSRPGGAAGARGRRAGAPASRGPTASSAPSPGTAKAGDAELAEPLARRARRAAAEARQPPTAGSPTFLEGELQPVAGEHDAVGRDIYALQSRHFLGAVIDLDETYEWGVEELARMVAEQESIANEIVPGASVAEAIAFLDGDPSRKLHGTDALQRWMQETSDRAVAELAGDAVRHPRRDPHARVPDRADARGRHLLHGPERRLHAARAHVVVGARGRHRVRHLARAHDRLPRGRAGPSPADRPGRRQPRASSTRGGASSPARRGTPRDGRSMPSGSCRGSATSTIPPTDSACSTASACARPAWCSTSACTSASSDPTATARGRGSTRSSSSAQNVNMNEGFVRFEVNRYLGWPGQAPSYKVGQRIWEQLRDEVARREGGVVRHPRVPPACARPRRRRPRHAARCAARLSAAGGDSRGGEVRLPPGERVPLGWSVTRVTSMSACPSRKPTTLNLATGSILSFTEHSLHDNRNDQGAQAGRNQRHRIC